MGRRSLAGHSPQGHKELDTTEAAAHARTVLTYTHPKTKFLRKVSTPQCWKVGAFGCLIHSLHRGNQGQTAV